MLRIDLYFFLCISFSIKMINVVRQLGPWFDQRVAIFDRRQRRSNPQHQSEVATRRR